jgi:hypothetical protein
MSKGIPQPKNNGEVICRLKKGEMLCHNISPQCSPLPRVGNGLWYLHWASFRTILIP